MTFATWIEDAWWAWANCIYFRFDYNNEIDRCAFFEEISLGWHEMQNQHTNSQEIQVTISTPEMTIDELFDHVTQIIASPHTAITEHDKRRAIQVFLCFDDYLIDAFDGYCEAGCEIDFGFYAAGVLDELEGK